MAQWNNGTMEQCSNRTVKMEQWNNGTMAQWN